MTDATKPEASDTVAGPLQRPVGRLVPERERGGGLTCDGCSHKRRPDGGWCYMFRDKPQGLCMKHTAFPTQVPNEFGNLLTTAALWQMYAE